MDFDVEHIDAGSLAAKEQTDADDLGHPRYWITDAGRHALLDESAPICQACGTPSIDPLRAASCIVCNLLGVA